MHTVDKMSRMQKHIVIQINTVTQNTGACLYCPSPNATGFLLCVPVCVCALVRACACVCVYVEMCWFVCVFGCLVSVWVGVCVCVYVCMCVRVYGQEGSNSHRPQ